MSSTPISPAPSSPERSGSTWWADRRFWLGMLISVVCLVLAFRNVRWLDLAVAMRSVDWAVLALAGLAVVLDLFLRGLRWRILLVPVGAVPVGDAFSFLNIGAMANNVLPLRAGEIIRSVLLGSKHHLSKSAVFATVVVERLFDVLMLVVMALILMAAMPLPVLVKQAVVVIGIAGFGLAVVFWWVAGHLTTGNTSRLADRLGALVDRLAGPPETPRRVLGIQLSGPLHTAWTWVQSFAGGLGVVRSPRLTTAAAGYTVLSWLSSVAYVLLVLRACHLDLPWTAALMVMVIVNFGAALPSSPGALGVVHVLAMLALTPWNVPQPAALTFAIMLHAVLFLVTVLMGLASLWHEGLNWQQLAGASNQQLTTATDDL